jgi:hypothetical protein
MAKRTAAAAWLHALLLALALLLRLRKDLLQGH